MLELTKIHFKATAYRKKAVLSPGSDLTEFSLPKQLGGIGAGDRWA
jgi:hypothetical protein